MLWIHRFVHRLAVAMHSGIAWLLQGVDFFGGEPLKNEDDLMKAVEWESEHEEDRIVFISDIWLDDPGTLPSLDAIFSGTRSSQHPQ